MKKCSSRCVPFVCNIRYFLYFYETSCRNLVFMKFIIVSVLLLACAAFTAQGQPALDELSGLFEKQLRLCPQEKLYVHTDKSCYIAGEDIWFRAYLVDGTTHIADTTSRYVYAELIDPQGGLVTRVKVRPEAGIFQGRVPLGSDIPGGDYLLRCYTRFMESRGDDCFFKKTIRVGAPFSSLFKAEASFAFDARRGSYNVSLRFRDLDKGGWAVPAEVSISENGRENLRLAKGDPDGVFTAQVSGGTRVVYLEYLCGDKKNMEFIAVRPPAGDFDVAFLPEGGNMIYGQPSRVGFKAVGSDGLGVDVSVALVNAAGDTLGVVSSQHRGMGRFQMTPEPGQEWHAVCSVEGSAPKRFELPRPAGGVVALRSDWKGSDLHISLTADPSFDGPVSLLMQCRGYLIYAMQLDDPGEVLSVSRYGLPGGVIQLIAVDKEMRPLSERLVFNTNTVEQAFVSFDTKKPFYGGREHVEGSWNICSIADRAPLSGSFSVSVTDDRYVDRESGNNIYSELLLASELKGHIESPAYYFRGENALEPLHLDMLMMTQGWSRYDVDALLRGEVEPARGYIELGPVVSGVVRGGLFMSRTDSDYPVTIISMGSLPVIDETVTDKEGRFSFNLPETPEGTGFVVQGKGLKGGKGVELLLDPEDLPEPRYTVPHPDAAAAPLQNNYMRRAEEKYVSENGIRMIVLDEIELKASEIPSVRHSSYPRSGIFMSDISGDRLSQYHTMRTALAVMGVNYFGGSYSIRGSSQPPLFMADGARIEPEMVDDLTIDDVAEIAVIKDGSSAAFYGQGSGSGVVLISFKRGFDQTMFRREIFNIKTVVPLGYQPFKEFYSPRYETPEQLDSTVPDLRTTLYWNPGVASDADGNVPLDFYTGDTVGPYTVTLEGITDDGRPVHSKFKISGKE